VDAIVIVEDIVRHRDTGVDKGVAIEAALSAPWAALSYSNVTAASVFSPGFAITGVSGVFVRDA
jgi:multidrug efflux pump subunit AcrB